MKFFERLRTPLAALMHDVLAIPIAWFGAYWLRFNLEQVPAEFLRAGLIRRVIISRLPVLIGEGIPLFGSVPHDIRLSHIATRTYPGGMVQSEYHIIP